MILEIGAPRGEKMKMAVRACARSRPARGRGEIRAVRGFKVVYDGRVAALEEEKRKLLANPRCAKAVGSKCNLSGHLLTNLYVFIKLRLRPTDVACFYTLTFRASNFRKNLIL